MSQTYIAGGDIFRKRADTDVGLAQWAGHVRRILVSEPQIHLVASSRFDNRHDQSFQSGRVSVSSVDDRLSPPARDAGIAAELAVLSRQLDRGYPVVQFQGLQ